MTIWCNGKEKEPSQQPPVRNLGDTSKGGHMSDSYLGPYGGILADPSRHFKS